MTHGFTTLAQFFDHGFDTVIDVRSPSEFAADHVPGALNLPETALGWFGLVGGSLAFVTAILCFFTALKAVETVTATLIANLEPILAIGLAYLVLGEVLTLTQLAGGAIVVGAILLPSLAGKRSDG